MTAGEPAELVETMRGAQKTCFKTRAPSALSASRRLEARVDGILAERRQRLADGAQAKLFEEA